MPQLNSVSVSFPGDDSLPKYIFRNVNLSIPQGKITCVVGPSGCGKTTLLRLLAGLQKADSGNVSYEAEDISQISESRPLLSYCFQENRLFPRLTAEQNIGVVFPNAKQADAAESVAYWLEHLHLTDSKNLYPTALSGGMQRRIALARSLCLNSPIVLLDEPFTGLDAALHEELLQLVKTERNGKTTILSSHDLLDQSICDYRLTLSFENQPIIEII